METAFPILFYLNVFHQKKKCVCFFFVQNTKFCKNSICKLDFRNALKVICIPFSKNTAILFFLHNFALSLCASAPTAQNPCYGVGSKFIRFFNFTQIIPKKILSFFFFGKNTKLQKSQINEPPRPENTIYTNANEKLLSTFFSVQTIQIIIQIFSTNKSVDIPNISEL